MDKFLTILTFVFIIGLFALGWACHGLYSTYQNKQQIAGLYLQGYNQTEAKEKAYSMDSSGQWVMVNINSGLSYKEVYNVCIHECSHNAYSELFARKCEEDPIKCQNIINAGSNETN